jgi:hypothetical protein
LPPEVLTPQFLKFLDERDLGVSKVLVWTWLCKDPHIAHIDCNDKGEILPAAFNFTMNNNKSDVRFYDMVYGQAATKNFGWNTGNTAPGDGYKYRGRGFNGITFKSLYQKYQDMLNKDNKLGRPIDIVNNPDQLNEIDVAAEAAVLFFISGAKNDVMQRKYGTKDINTFTDQNTALKGIVNINAGLGNDVTGTYLGGLEKATAIANQFTISPTGASNVA